MKLRWRKTDSRAARSGKKGAAVAALSADALLAHPPISVEEMQTKAAHATALLKSMANETRLMILCQLSDGEHSVSELCERIPLSQSALSQHLAVLRRERLVATRRDGQSIFYSLASHEVRAIIGTLYELFCDDACG
jgi:DNA-binding transcriptional ArsR family regulator